MMRVPCGASGIAHQIHKEIMSHMKNLRVLLSSVALVTVCGSVQAADFSFTGMFENDNDVQLFDFSVGAESLVTLRTYSYAGGIMADGTIIAAGGFDPILALFNADTGAFIDDNDDGSFPDVGIDPVTGEAYDTFFQATLGVGNYTVAVSQYDNFALGNVPGGNLSAGFTYDGPGNENFTAVFDPTCITLFCDVEGDSRTGNWAFDILNVESASTPPSAVPLPAGLPLLIGALGGLAVVRRKKNV